MMDETKSVGGSTVSGYMIDPVAREAVERSLRSASDQWQPWPPEQPGSAERAFAKLLLAGILEARGAVTIRPDHSRAITIPFRVSGDYKHRLCREATAQANVLDPGGPGTTYLYSFDFSDYRLTEDGQSLKAAVCDDAHPMIEKADNFVDAIAVADKDNFDVLCAPPVVRIKAGKLSVAADDASRLPRGSDQDEARPATSQGDPPKGKRLTGKEFAEWMERQVTEWVDSQTRLGREFRVQPTSIDEIRKTIVNPATGNPVGKEAVSRTTAYRKMTENGITGGSRSVKTANASDLRAGGNIMDVVADDAAVDLLAADVQKPRPRKQTRDLRRT